TAAGDALIVAVIKEDATRLQEKAMTPIQLAAAPLWPRQPPPHFLGDWEGLSEALRARGKHWSVWTDWYNGVLVGGARTEAENAAFTDLPGELPWDIGEDAVNTEIARRLTEIWDDQEPSQTRDLSTATQRNRRPLATIISDLAEVASPQPAL